MGTETGSSGHIERVDRIELPYSDKELEAIVCDPEASHHLLRDDPVLWLRCAIGVDTERGASCITDYELAVRHSEGGFAEWDPQVAQAARDYLTARGFIGLRGSSRTD